MNAQTVIARLAKFRALGLRCQCMVAAASLLLPVVALLVKVVGYARLMAHIERGGVARAVPSRDVVREIGRAVNIAGLHGLVRVRCLSRSILLHWLLRRSGVQSQLRIGVRADRGGIRAHAWIELDGEPVNDAPGVRHEFSAFAPRDAAGVQP
ncbi:lasso peptide biosynthesis B2 protein [Ramlibacter albus]|uniref:Lasso peptide biosynthesis B2 protein n=1 Tax=Ramlibacter albus TaxID=2079448 RepID=A0A923S2G1_9BURK|nr:lasso peptide biosynthesis B2 protein [Ramlibacter albus]MBC5765306.1 lasso peptide biosynthesis B2 protein [Ramlibacter albus]